MVAEHRGALEHARRRGHRLRVLLCGQADRGQRRFAPEQPRVMRRRQLLRGDRGRVPAVESRGDPLGVASQLGSDVGDRPTADVCRRQPHVQGATQDEGCGGGEPHPLARRREHTQPAEAGQEQRDGPVGVAEAQEEPQARRDGVRGVRVVLGQLPGPPERGDRGVDVPTVEPQVRVEGERRVGPLTAGQLTGHHTTHEGERPVGVGAPDELRLLDHLARRAATARLVRGPGEPLLQLVLGGSPVAARMGETGARGVDGPEAGTLSTQRPLQVVDRADQLVEVHARRVLGEVDGPPEPQHHRVTVGLREVGSGVEGLTQPVDVDEVLGGAGHTHERFGEVEPRDELLRERAGRQRPTQRRLVGADPLRAGWHLVRRERRARELRRHLVPLAHAVPSLDPAPIMR